MVECSFSRFKVRVVGRRTAGFRFHLEQTGSGRFLVLGEEEYVSARQDFGSSPLS